MIERLKGHISEEEISIILEMIKNQYSKYLKLTESHEYQSLFSEEYAPHKRQHSISWAISSAFPSCTTVGDSLIVKRLKYGKGHTRPALINNTIELHILNRTTHFDAAYLKERYEYNCNDFTGKKLFAYIKFSVDHNRLTSISLCLPDKNGSIVEEESLLCLKIRNHRAA